MEQFRFAELSELLLLEALQRRSSLATGDCQEQLLANPEAMEIPASAVAEKRARVAISGGRILGFSIVLPVGKQTGELDALFVEPDLFSTGIGRALLADASMVARMQGLLRIEVTANPRAIGFYEKIGFIGDGIVPTRFAPALRMHLDLDGSGVPKGSSQRDLQTERLFLRRVDLRDFEECRRDDASFLRKQNLKPTPDFANWLQPADKDATVAIEWDSFIMISREEPALIGACGCRKFPNEAGEIEIAYGLAPSFWNKGLATQAASALVRYAFGRKNAVGMTALTLPQENASTRVLSKCGFVRTGTAIDPDEGVVWKWTLPK